MKITRALNIGLASFGLLAFVACDDNSGKLEEGSLSANRLIEVPASASEEGTAEITALPVLKFEEMEFNFGEIESGEVVEHTFMFTNTGDGPLLITNAQASCGCTVPVWPKEPIEPNGSGEIKVRFDSKGKSGQQNKTVTVTANTQPSQTKLAVIGNVKSPVEKADNNS